MKRCPITYKPISEGKYSIEGLKKLSKNLESLKDLPYTAEDQRIEARKRAHKMSLQGVQIKLSARLNIQEGEFEIVDTGGQYILKPQNNLYSHLPENEDLTMHLADTVGIKVPLHGLVYSTDESLTYFVKRFDRLDTGSKLAMEDFAQLSSFTRETKYDSSVEGVVKIIENFCTFPVVQKEDFFLRFVFNFLVGNEDMHLKNYSLISFPTLMGRVTELSPGYDLLNSAIVVEDPVESALPLGGKKNKFKKTDIVEYLGMERLGLNKTVIDDVLKKIDTAVPEWMKLIDNSFLPESIKKDYKNYINQKREVLWR